jgi:predicted RND superfamily exporter protein
MENVNVNKVSLSETSLSETSLSDTSLSYLKRGSPWFRFLAILALIGVIFMAAVGLIALAAGLIDYFNADGGREALRQIGMGAGYLLIAPLALVTAVFMLRSSKALKLFCQKPEGNGAKLEVCFKNLKSLAKFSGILSIVLLALAVAAVICVIIAALVVGSTFTKAL